MLLSIGSIINNSIKAVISKSQQIYTATNSNTSLVYSLICSHQDMTIICIEIRSAANRQYYRHATSLVSKLEKDYRQHIRKENENLYPSIINNVVNETMPYVKSCQLWSTSIALDLKHFVERLNDADQNFNQIMEIYNNWDALEKMLTKLMAAKEMELYPLYNKNMIYVENG